MRLLGIAALVIVLCVPAALAADTGANTPDNDIRLFQQFFTDAALANQWFEGQIRLQNGAVPPVEDSDGLLIGGVIAVRPWKNVEVGGRGYFVDYDLDHAIFRPGETRPFNGASGASDIDLYGKYRILQGPVQFAVGGSLTLPTGSEEEGLGTGKFVPAVFGAVRGDMGGKATGDFIGVAHLGFRFNSDADIFRVHENGKTSVFLGAGFIVKWQENVNWTGEVTVESERFKGPSGGALPGTDSDIRLTGGLQWNLAQHHTLRGAAAVGLADASPDFELIGGYVYSF